MNVGDGFVIDNLVSLNSVIDLREDFIRGGMNPPPYFPGGIEHYVDLSVANEFWEQRSYESIRILYAEAWAEEASLVMGSPPELSISGLIAESRRTDEES